MTMTRPLARTLIAVLAVVAGGACEQRASSERTISYLPNRPIAERLLPSDKHVVVQMKTSTALKPAPERTFEQEIEALRRSEIIALVRVGSTSSEIADGGTWIRTTVDTAIDRLLKAKGEKPFDGSLRFSFSGGAAKIGDVVVSTGKFPQFVEGDQYLLFLSNRPGVASAVIWSGIGFRVDAQGLLQRVGINDGSEQSFPTNLIGRDASEVADLLGR